MMLGRIYQCSLIVSQTYYMLLAFKVPIDVACVIATRILSFRKVLFKRIRLKGNGKGMQKKD